MKEYICKEDIRNELYEADAITMRGGAIISAFPAADVRENKRGEWHDHYQLAEHCYIAICSCCHSHVCFYDGGLPYYCPNCGAQMGMREEQT